MNWPPSESTSSRLQEMDDLDLQLYAVGIDVGNSEDTPGESELDRELEPAIAPRRNGRGFDDGLWDLALPPSDGVDYLLRWPADPLPTIPQTSGDRDDQQTAARRASRSNR